MNTKVKNVLEEYHVRMAQEADLMKSLPKAEGMKRRDEFLLPVGKEVGFFLNSLVKGAKSQVIVEIGTSYGYSTVWLAEAAQAHGGKVITLELDAKKVDYARSMMVKAGLESVVVFKVGDALESLRKLNINIDFVLLDLWKELYLPCFQEFKNKLNPDAFVLSDNMIHPAFHKEQTEAYKRALLSSGRFESVLLPIGSGIEVSRLRS